MKGCDRKPSALKHVEVMKIFYSLKTEAGNSVDISAQTLAKEAKDGRNFLQKIKEGVNNGEIECPPKQHETRGVAYL
eukprot:14327308-Ditylum_brightwellii.AAC.1